MSKPGINFSPVNWDMKHSGITTSVEVPCYNNLDLITEPSDVLPTMILLGYGERRRVAETTLRVLGEKQISAVAVDVSFNYIPADKSRIEQAAAEVTHAVADNLKEMAGLKPEDTIEAIGHSGGGGVWAWARQYRAEGLGDAVLWAPIGFSHAEDIELSEKARIMHFLKRYAPNAFKQNLGDPATYPATFEIGSQIVFDLLTRRFLKKVGFAVTNAVQRQAVEHVNSGFRLAILSTDDDGVFPEAETQQSVMACRKPGDNLPDFIMAPGAHVPMSSKVGLSQLAVATDYLLVSR